jgi:hypothetical protein
MKPGSVHVVSHFSSPWLIMDSICVIFDQRPSVLADKFDSIALPGLF